MGNKCTKASNRVSPETSVSVSPETLPVQKSLKWRFFQAVGLGKFCATVDIQQETRAETGQTLVVAQSVSDWMRVDIDVLYYESSLICMLDNENPKGYLDNKDVASETKVQQVLPVLNGSQYEASSEALDTADEHTTDYQDKGIISEENEDKSADYSVIDMVKEEKKNRDEIGKDFNGRDDAIPTKTTLNKDIDNRQTEDDPHRTDVDDTHRTDVDDTHRTDVDDTHITDVDDTHRTDVDDTRRTDVEDTHRTDVDVTHIINVDDTHRSVVDDTHRTDVDDTHRTDVDDTHRTDVYDTHITDVDDTHRTDVDDKHQTDVGDKHKTYVDDTPQKGLTQYDRKHDQTTRAENVETSSDLKMTSSDSSASTDDGVLQQQPFNQMYFSAGSAHEYEGFSEGKQEEVDEEIEIEEDHNEALKDDQPESVKIFSLIKARKIAKKSGRGEVSLPDGEIMAAKYRLSFLSQGLDPDIETQRYACTPKDVAYVEDGYDQSFKPTEDDTIHRADPGNPMEDRETDNNCDISMTTKTEDINPGHETSIANVDTNASHKGITKYHNVTQTKDGIEVVRIHERLTSPPGTVPESAVKTRGSDTVISLELAGISGSEGHLNNEPEDNMLSDTSIKSSVSLAIDLSLQSIKSHSSRSDCLMSFYVRSPHLDLEPRKVEVRASAKQVKDGLVEKHLNQLKNVHLPATPVCQVPMTGKKSKKHLFTTPSLADKHDDTTHTRWTQTQGRTDHVKLHSVPTCYKSTGKTLNSRERLGLGKLRKYGIGLQCKEIERIKVDSEEFPGVLPPKIRAKWQKKMDEKNHIN